MSAGRVSKCAPALTPSSHLSPDFEERRTSRALRRIIAGNVRCSFAAAAFLVVVLPLTKRGLFDFRSPVGFLRRYDFAEDFAEDIGIAA